MAQNKFPTPPDTDNPIVLLRAMSLGQEYDFLKELMAAHEAGAVDRAAKCVIAVLSTRMKRTMVNAMISVVNNLANTANDYPPSLKTMLCNAADLGFNEFAYNAANHIMSHAESVKDYQEAVRFFKIAMTFDENPALQAAAYVNYCPIIRDGLISGARDWPAAVKIYETAARMGLVKAMFNAGNVCSWLCSKGDQAYGERAAYWFKYALDYRAAGKPMLDMDTEAELTEVFDQCALELAACHIDSKFEDAQLEEGIRLVKELINKGNSRALSFLKVGYMRRLAALTAKPQKSPGANWREVLSQMDWLFKGEITTAQILISYGSGPRVAMAVDKLTLELIDGSEFPLFVTLDPCLPVFGGFDLIDSVAAALANEHPKGFFLVARRALFIEDGGQSYTPMYVLKNGQFGAQALWLGSTPNLMLQNAEQAVSFLDPRFGNSTCMIPIALNALDEGFVVANNTVLGQPWVDAGGRWCMPFVARDQLSELGLALRE